MFVFKGFHSFDEFLTDLFTFEQIDKSISNQDFLVTGLDKGVQTLEIGRNCLNINFFYPPPVFR